MAIAKPARAPEEQPEGAPEWMVTFGDMMSLLLAFFVMLFSISEIKEEKFSAAVSSFREYFDLKGGAQDSANDETVMIQTFQDVFLEFVKGRGHNEGGQPIDSSVGDHPQARKIREGLMITVGGVARFAEGSARLELGADGRSAVLDEIADKLRGYQFKIDVRGHAVVTEADAADGPVDQSLKRLSFARASNVERYLVEKGGIRAERISVTAEAAHDPAGQSAKDEALNRRVEIVASERRVQY